MAASILPFCPDHPERQFGTNAWGTNFWGPMGPWAKGGTKKNRTQRKKKGMRYFFCCLLFFFRCPLFFFRCPLFFFIAPMSNATKKKKGAPHARWGPM